MIAWIPASSGYSNCRKINSYCNWLNPYFTFSGYCYKKVSRLILRIGIYHRINIILYSGANIYSRHLFTNGNSTKTLCENHTKISIQSYFFS